MLFGFAAIVAWILLYFSSRFRPSAAVEKASCGDESFSPGTSASFSRYEFSAGKGVSGFVEEPRAVSFLVQEMMAVDSGETSPLVGKDALIHEQLEYSAEEGEEDEDEDRLDQYFDSETFQDAKLIEEGDCDFEPSVHAEDEGLEVREEEQKLSSGGDASPLESQGGFAGEAGLEDKVLGEEDPPSHESWISSDCVEGEASANYSALVMDHPNQSDDDEGYIELKLPELQKDTSLEKQGKLGFEQLQEEEESTSESDSLWEHEDIVEQLKLELRNVRTGGLRTILEESESESESPCNEASGGLKPMKIDDKTENKDRIRDIQKVYKSYSERMKKLDVLNYQTLHAIGLIQLRATVPGRSSAGAVATSLISDHYSRKSRLRRRQVDPMMESIGAYYQELEMVYVGHVCLSWEILQWQYIKAQELLESSRPWRAEQYNQVTSELQLFRVLLQRFLEDEPFRGSSRVENYARTRCILRSLLQVPAVRDDCFKDKKAKVRDEDAVSAASLLSQIEESMKVFLDFLRRDKHEDNTVHRGPKPSWADNQQCLDADLMTSLRTQLQKKERRLKETLRIEGCITKKFRRKKDGDVGRPGHSMLVAQVDLRLVSRVLKARRLTRDQADWCREKIARISFAGGKITVEEEPSFLLFPC